MREPISRDFASPRELAEATRRLDCALAQLEAACAAKVAVAAGARDDAPDLAAYVALESDVARLAADLDAARAREGELESAALAASQALGRAAIEVRAAIGPDALTEDAFSDADEASTPDGDGLNEEAA